MWIELLVSSLAVMTTVAFHGVSLAALSWALEKVHPRSEEDRRKRAIAATLLTTGLIAISTIEVWAYALFYVGAGALPDLRTAVYFSTSSFSTLGFSDAQIVDRWKLVGAIEGINGALLMGWSVAFLVAEMTRHMRTHRPSRVQADTD